MKHERRLRLPRDFASSTVIIERVGENELRIRSAVVVPVDEYPFIENQLKPLSDRDRDLFLKLLEDPPEPTAAPGRGHEEVPETPDETLTAVGGCWYHYFFGPHYNSTDSRTRLCKCPVFTSGLVS